MPDIAWVDQSVSAGKVTASDGPPRVGSKETCHGPPRVWIGRGLRSEACSRLWESVVASLLATTGAPPDVAERSTMKTEPCGSRDTGTIVRPASGFAARGDPVPPDASSS